MELIPYNLTNKYIVYLSQYNIDKLNSIDNRIDYLYKYEAKKINATSTVDITLSQYIEKALEKNILPDMINRSNFHLSRKNHDLGYTVDNCEFLTAKENVGERNTRYSGENHPMYGKTGIDHYNYGKVRSEETRSKLSESKLGNTNSLGHKHSETSRNKMSESSKHRPYRTCPHCNLSSNGAAMNRWHFDNCKLRKE